MPSEKSKILEFWSPWVQFIAAVLAILVSVGSILLGIYNIVANKDIEDRLSNTDNSVTAIEASTTKIVNYLNQKSSVSGNIFNDIKCTNTGTCFDLK
jgi:multisubunit Na+/H+ antiporter MnhF subunit